MKYYLSYTLLIFAVFFTEKVYGTAQYPDMLIDGKDTIEIFSNPLEQYLREKEERVFCGKKLVESSTACWRGYLATWTISKDSLFLTDVFKGCGESHERKFNLKKEFKEDKVFANWFSGVILCPIEPMLQYVHMGYGSIFEGERFIHLTNGLVDSIVTKKYLDYNEDLLYPGEGFLYDTIRRVILNNIDSSKIGLFSDTSMCRIEIKFDLDGLIDSIYNGYTYDGLDYLEEYLLSVAKKSLYDFPKLMHVSHPDFRAQLISISFSGYCLINPCDYEYGCENYGCQEDRDSIRTRVARQDNVENEVIQKLNWIIYLIISILILGLIIYIIKRKNK